MWENSEIDLGMIHANVPNNIVFKFIGDCMPENVQIHSSCGCSPGVWNEQSREMTVSYTPSKIPSQVVGNQHVRKVTKIVYLCNGVSMDDNLFFKAQIINE